MLEEIAGLTLAVGIPFALVWSRLDAAGRGRIAAWVIAKAIFLLRALCCVATFGRRGAIFTHTPSATERVLRPRAVTIAELGIAAKPIDFDFVVIGAGAAGLAAVQRLCDRTPAGELRILLVDEGPLALGAGDDDTSQGGPAPLPEELAVFSLPAYVLQARHPRHGRVVPASTDTHYQINAPARGVDGRSAVDDSAFTLLSEEEWCAATASDEAVGRRAFDAQCCLLGAAATSTSPAGERREDPWLLRETDGVIVRDGKFVDAQDAAAPVVRSWAALFVSPLSWVARITAARMLDDHDDEDTKDDASSATGTLAIRFMRNRWDPSRGFAKDRLSTRILSSAACTRPGVVVRILSQTRAVLPPQPSNGKVSGQGPTTVELQPLTPGGNVVTPTGGAPHPYVTAKRGVVVAAGERRSYPATAAAAAGEASASSPSALVIPVIYQARPDITYDPITTQTVFTVASHAAKAADFGAETKAVATTLVEAIRAGKGSEVAEEAVPHPPDLSWPAAMCDAFIRVDCHDCPAAEKEGHFFVELLPAGGFNRELFTAQSWSPALGVFKEAFTLRITIPASQRSIASLPVHAVRWVRQFATQRDPLSALTTGREALDLSLMPEDEVPRHAFKLLYGKPKKPPSRAAERAALQRQAADVFAEVRRLAESDAYVERYVSIHGQEHPGALSYHHTGTGSGPCVAYATVAAQLRPTARSGECALEMPGALFTAKLVAGSLAADAALEGKA